jgi:hypothetical protein
MIDLVHDQRDAARGQRFRQLALLVGRHDGAGGIVRAVHEHHARRAVDRGQYTLGGL